MVFWLNWAMTILYQTSSYIKDTGYIKDNVMYIIKWIYNNNSVTDIARWKKNMQKNIVAPQRSSSLWKLSPLPRPLKSKPWSHNFFFFFTSREGILWRILNFTANELGKNIDVTSDLIFQDLSYQTLYFQNTIIFSTTLNIFLSLKSFKCDNRNYFHYYKLYEKCH